MYLMKLRSVWSLALLTLFLGSFASLQAAPTTKQNANKAVSAWLKRSARPLNAKMRDEILSIDTYKDDAGTVLYYVVNLNPEGYVVISGDDLVQPVIAFSQSGKYDPVPENPMYTLLQGDLQGRIKYVKDLQKEAKKNNKLFKAKGASLKSKTKWTQLLDAPELQEADTPQLQMAASSVDDLRVSPLVLTKWDQSNEGGDACYNYYTPSGPGNWPEGNTGNIVCGCVATVMAQIMRLHQYPTDGVGTASYQVYVNGNPEDHALRGGDGSGGAYDWGNMVLEPDSSSTEVQRKAIGSLCADAGVAVHMQYASDGSGAYAYEAALAFKNVFGYGNAIMGYDSMNELVGNGFIAMANPNLDAGYPVTLGLSGDGGHSVVCDGYGYNSSTLYHHLNMGWAGSDDAWYELPDIGAGFNFDKVTDCTYNVFPSGAGEIISGRVLDGSGVPVNGLTITADDGSTEYTDVTDDKGVYGIRVPSSTSFTLSCPGADDKTVETGRSISETTIVGNLWEQNFTSVTGPLLSYSFNTFNEAAANNGSIENSITITLFQDTFKGANGTDVAANVTVANLPNNLTAVFTKNSDTQLTVTLTGNAVNHTDADDVNNLTFTFLNAAFVGGDASAKTNYDKSDLKIDFPPPPPFYTASFESGLDGWIQNAADDFDWTRHSGVGITRDIGFDTGPASAQDGTWYMYIDVFNSNDPSHTFEIAELQREFDFTGKENLNLSFYYHMFGSSIDSLHVVASTDGGNSWSSSLWSKSGDQGDNWYNANVDLSDYSDEEFVIIKFIGNGGDAFSDIAIDNITLRGSDIAPAGPEMDVTRSGAVTDGGSDSVAGTTSGSGTQLTYTIANSGTESLTVQNAVKSAESNCSVAIDTQPSSSVAASGNTSLVVTVTPSSAGDWSFNLSVGNNDSNENPYNWTVSGATIKTTPTVNTWPTASAITYGQSLSDSSLSGGDASVAGAFAFTTPGTAPGGGTASQDVTFTPTDTASYNTVAGTVDVICNKADSSITATGTTSFTYSGSGQGPDTSNVTGSTGAISYSYSGTGGTTYSASATKPTAVGTYQVIATVATDANYNGATSDVLAFTIAEDETPPVAEADSYSTDVNVPLVVVAAPGVLANDSGSGLTAIEPTDPSNGTLDFFAEDGSFTYTPETGFTGSDSFTYKAHNAHGDSETTVTINVGDSGLYLHWKLDEPSGLIAEDATTNSRNGTVSGGATWTTSGKIDGGIQCDGSGKVVYDMSDTVFPAYTVTVWARSGADDQDNRSSVFNNNADGDDFQIDLGNDNNNYFQYKGTTSATIGASIVGTWAHLAVVCDGTDTVLYYNGAYVDTLTGTADNNFGRIEIGVNRGGVRFFNGTIDDFRVYERALTATEIENIYNPGDSDGDSDGMPDDWELEHGFDTGTNDADADADDDGMSNYKEYISGTNPTNASSLLCLENFDLQAGASNIVVKWQSATGRYYSIIGCTNLVDPSWDVLHSNIPATPSTNEFTINVDDKSHYYRIRVEQ